MEAVFSVGDVVRLVGVLPNKKLNGAVGTVVGNIDSKTLGMVEVKLAAHPSGISISPLNLMKLSVCAGCNCDKIGTRTCSGE
jgi:hypothetical protein